MIGKGSSYSRFASWIVASGAAFALVTQASPSFADDVPATGKGITGGALLGGEVVMLAEAVFGVKSGWAYVIGGIVGAGGGAVGGWQIEKNADSKVSVYMLAGGMALVIPTTVAVLQASSYKPPEDYTEDHPAAGTPVPEPPRAAPGAPPPAASPSPVGPATLHYHWAPAKLKLPAGFVDFEDGAVKLAVPAFEVRPVYRLDELAKYGLEQKHELRVSVLSATF